VVFLDKYHTVGMAPEFNKKYHTVGMTPESNRKYHTVGMAPEFQTVWYFSIRFWSHFDSVVFFY
jgi:hypothetical protein